MFEATTIVAVKKNGKVAMAGDGQVTMGQSVIMKHNARKVRRLYKNKILAGFAGSVADAFALFERFEGEVEKVQGDLKRAAVALTKDWRTDKYLRKLEAMLIVADNENILLLSGTGEVIEPDDDIVAIGSGGSFALAAAKALKENTDLEPVDIVKKAMLIASEICVFTNDHIIVEEL